MNKSVKQAVYFDILHENTTVYANTPQEIRNVFNKYRNTYIPDDKILTIQLAPGVYEFDSPLFTRHRCGEQIIIRGAEPSVHNITLFNGYNATAKTMSFSVTNMELLSPGDYVMITETMGGNRYLHPRGIYSINSLSGSSSVTINYPYKKDMSVFSGTTVTSGKLYRFATVLKFKGCHGIYAEGQNSAQLDDVAIVGDGTGEATRGIYLHISRMYNGALLGVTGFTGRGIYIDNANLERYGQSHIASCGNGGSGAYVCEGGHFYPGIEFIATCNGGAGLNVANTGLVIATTVSCFGNGSYGVSNKDSMINISGNLFVSDNLGYGVYTWLGARTFVASLWAYTNASYDVVLSVVAAMYVAKLNSFIQASVTTPVKNTLSSNGSYLYAP